MTTLDVGTVTPDEPSSPCPAVKGSDIWVTTLKFRAEFGDSVADAADQWLLEYGLVTSTSKRSAGSPTRGERGHFEGGSDA